MNMEEVKSSLISDLEKVTEASRIINRILDKREVVSSLMVLFLYK